LRNCVFIKCLVNARKKKQKKKKKKKKKRLRSLARQGERHDEIGDTFFPLYRLCFIHLEKKRCRFLHPET